MKILGALVCFVAGCLAQQPHPCESPPLMSGELTISTQNEKLWVYAKYLYDAQGQRVRLYEYGTMENKTFTFDFLLHYKEQVMYDIKDHERTCTKSPLKVDFMPMAIPKDASLLGQIVLGSSSGPGQGLLVNAWTGDLPNKLGKFLATVTEFGCFPVSNAFHTDQFGWMLTSYFNNNIGISDPTQLDPPSFCPSTDVTDGDEEPVDFFTLFFRKK
ncbi:ependymin-like [Cheilinus undulatus]|uniref:ependymin-like n=1 Tax=Cheilinus undulatus TaxID=241271 RepID=UPI001BD429EB|nr:ependymin-like [Cheilinus undulatus]